MAPSLESAFELLFKYRPFVFEKGRLVFDPPGVAATVLLLGTAVAVTVISYARARGAARPAERVALAVVRMAILALVLLCLCRPSLVLSSVVPQQSFVGIVMDDSRSMRVADEGEPRSARVSRTFAPDAALVAALSERFKLRFFRFAGSAERLESVADLGFDGQRTNLTGALDLARQELSAVPLSGLVLVSDGADNGDADVTSLLHTLKSRSIPVFTVGVGNERFTKDLELTRVEIPSPVLKGTSLTAEVRIAQRGFGGSTVQLQVEDAGRVVQSQEVRLPADGEAAATRVHLTAAEAGPRTFRFRVIAHGDEPIRENNQQDVPVQVLDRREKVLYVEGEPRYELKFVRRAVAEDKNLQVVCLQRTSQNKFLRLEVDDSEELAGGFPRTREELFKYRGLILGSVEAGFFTADQLRMIADFVSQRGGGLLALGGRHSFAEGGYGPTPLADVLPVVMEDVHDPKPVFSQVKVEPTAFGMTHGVTQLATSEDDSAERWKALPPLSVLNPVQRTKPGAVSLLVGRGDALRDQVILAYQRYGAGKSLAFTVQDSWLWQMHADVPLEDMTHENLWRQLLRWLVSGVPGPVSVAVTPERAAPGSSVTVLATVNDEAFLKVNDARVAARVKGPSGEEREIPLEWTVGKDGEYRGSFEAREKGHYEVKVEARRADKTLGEDTAHVQAADLDTEYFGAEMKKGVLQRIADETGGRFYTLDKARTLAEDMAYSGGGATVQEQKPLWDMPALYLLIVVLVSAEWLYRKRRGLA